MIQPIAIIEIKGVPELLNKLDAVKRPETIKRGMDNAAMNLVRWIRNNRLTGPRPTYLGVRTGRLRSSISFTPTDQKGGIFTTRIGTNVEYARIHEFGGVIRAVNKPYLVFKIRDTDQWVSKKQVTIPARPFMRPALEDSNNRKMILDEMVMAIEEAIKKEKK